MRTTVQLRLMNQITKVRKDKEVLNQICSSSKSIVLLCVSTFVITIRIASGKESVNPWLIIYRNCWNASGLIEMVVFLLWLTHYARIWLIMIVVSITIVSLSVWIYLTNSISSTLPSSTIISRRPKMLHWRVYSWNLSMMPWMNQLWYKNQAVSTERLCLGLITQSIWKT